LFSKSVAVTAVLLLANNVAAVKVSQRYQRKMKFLKGMRSEMNRYGGVEMQNSFRKLNRKMLSKSINIDDGVKLEDLDLNELGIGLKDKKSNLKGSANDKNVRRVEDNVQYYYYDAEAEAEQEDAEAEDGEGDDLYDDVEIDDYYYIQNQQYTSSGMQDMSLKYASCHSLETFVGSAEEDQENESGSPFKRYDMISYRACPTDSCATDSWQGCKREYGQFLIDMDEYLELKRESLEEQAEQYCYFCKFCTYFNYNFGNCDKFDSCEFYMDVCEEENEEEDTFDYEDFLSCTAVDLINSGYYDDDAAAAQAQGDDDAAITQVYLGTYCDGSIKVGMFYDESCSWRVPEGTFGQTIYNATGYEVDEDIIEEDFTDSDCLSCSKLETLSEYYVPDYNSNQDEQENYMENMEDDISDLCENLYTQSAKCLQHVDNEYITYENEAEELGENLACNFLKSLEKNNVDEYGFVTSHQQTVNPIRIITNAIVDLVEEDVSAVQATMLTLTSISCIALGAYAYKLRQVVLDTEGSQGLLPNTVGESSLPDTVEESRKALD